MPTPGDVVTDVSAGSAADDAGPRSGDVITQAVDGQAVTTPDDLATAIAGHQPGDKVTVTYVRNGADHTIDVTLGTRNPTGG